MLRALLRPRLRAGTASHRNSCSPGQSGASGLLSLPAEDAPLFVPVASELRSTGTVVGAATRNSISISIEFGSAVVRATAGVDPACQRDVLRAVRATT